MTAWNQGATVKQMAEALNCTPVTVYNLARKIESCQRRRRGWGARDSNKRPPAPRIEVKSERADQRRFGTREAAPEHVRSLPPDSAAIEKSRTVYPTTVVTADKTQRILVSGHNNRKIGATIEKGTWSGMPIFMVTLEERATCPRSCFVYRSCYGNNMHLARRHAHGPLFERRLELELKIAAIENPQGFVVRLHALGDFYSPAYVAFWRRMLDEIPELRVWGYSANDVASTDANESDTARALQRLRWQYADRFALRWSRRSPTPGGSTVIDYVPEAPRVPEGLVCPAQMHATECCATCGLCWSPAARSETIVFIRHGRTFIRGDNDA